MTGSKGHSKSAAERKERKDLLDWAAAVTGIPLRHISQVQNGAVLCHIIAIVSEIDLSLVNYEAQEECECLANFRLLQTVAKAGKVRGLNHKAKLSHWGRLAECEADAWEFLFILKRCLTRAGKGDYCVDFEADATPPPPPLASRIVHKKESLSRRSSRIKDSAENYPRMKAFAAGSLVPPTCKADEEVVKLADELIKCHVWDLDPCFDLLQTPANVDYAAEQQESDEEMLFGRHLSGASTITANLSSSTLKASPSLRSEASLRQNSDLEQLRRGLGVSRMNSGEMCVQQQCVC